MPRIIRVDQVSKTFRTKEGEVLALNDVSLDIPEGAFFGIVGTSGAGKSTLLRMLNLLDSPTSGTILFRDRPLRDLDSGALRDYSLKVSTVFQSFNLFHGRTVLENIAFPLTVRKVPRTERLRRARELIELVGLDGKEKAYPSQLSGGQKQRVGIARALISDPEVLLCDEATSALDSATTAVILDLLQDLKRRLGFTVVLITHSWDVVRYACDSVALMQHGRLIEAGRVRDLLEDPASQLGPMLLPADGEETANGGADDTSDADLDLVFASGSQQSRVLSRLAREFLVDVELRSGRIEHIGGATYSRFLVRFTSQDDSRVPLESIRQTLTEAGVEIRENAHVR
ncbi:MULTISPECIES: methionine ABC transporter ATP-binding protein [unclassified Pseudoclavibacter]|uniref:methionine ABC transporter ATP-binding protein n=1 Tax=unclassified Pseudoclavibacter TaxID=2615177 RepID=UPI001301699B|nr:MULTISPECIES: methionine ABC transporter ATP-binding protein [unclassified Pseudoclavibacter]KAB1644489.1 methionine ABC transporter ATP-binding protein [Pseudoclavibacter sp. CFCC 14310]KAB1664007.1 methionine ABC transporter ATP-binding protein [Pseudoclavibacter sp. CFCC 13611]